MRWQPASPGNPIRYADEPGLSADAGTVAKFSRRFDSPLRRRRLYIRRMSYVTVEMEIDHGRIVAREPEKLPEKGNGLLTILLAANEPITETKPTRQRVELPLIRGNGKRIINPTSEELDASLWGD